MSQNNINQIKENSYITQEIQDSVGKNSSTVRSVSKILKNTATSDGAGVVINRSFPTNKLSYFDPFLLFDEMGPFELRPGEETGFPNHPHRGFETVTYMLEGKFQHVDSYGNSGILKPGDVQWMTAGSGVIHSEMPEKEFAKTGGTLHGFQLWVNLPKNNKMMKPRYQDIPNSEIPSATTPDGNITVKVIAGESLDTKAVIDTVTPIMYLHMKLQPSSRINQPIPLDYNVFAYVIRGNGFFDQDAKNQISKGHMIFFDKNGDNVYIQSSDDTKESLELLLIGGLPLEEPIARYGPFVMNTQDEIYQAIEDYQHGKLGKIDF